jgi:hypothetical protein
VARVLRASTRLGLSAIRAAGWRGPLLAVVGYVPLVGLASVLPGAFVVGLWLHVVVLVALARVLGAWRPAPLPEVPLTDDEGRRIVLPKKPGPPVTDADRSPVVALRNAFRLGRPALSLTGLFLLAGFAAGLAAVALSGGRIAEYSDNVQLAAVLPMSALFTAFVVLATQRVALEGDPRVLVAAAHSVRISRTNFGVLLLLSVAEPAVAAAGTLAFPGDDVLRPGVAVTLAVAAAVKVLVTAIGNEVYLAGPRLELPVDAASGHRLDQ